MSEVENLDLEIPVSSEPSEKMKRMRLAIKALAGWVSYLMGTGALALGTLTPLGTDIFTISIGLFIMGTGLFLLFQHIKGKNLQGKPRIVKTVKYLGGLLAIPGFVGTRVIFGQHYLHSTASTLFMVGAGLLFLSFLLRKTWKLNKKLEFIN